MFSRKLYYGLRFLLALAVIPKGRLRGVAEIAENEGLPLKFLEAIAVVLKKNGIVNVKRGAGGGYCLAKPLKEISLYEVVFILDDKWKKEVETGDSNPGMAVGLFLKDVKSEYESFLKKISLDKLKSHYTFENERIMYYI